MRWSLFIAGDEGGTNVIIEEGFQLVMHRRLEKLAAFVQAAPPALAVGQIVLDTLALARMRCPSSVAD
jgi:hypothetical protein